MKTNICLILAVLLPGLITASKSIPELYNLNRAQFTKDYSITYNNPTFSGEFGLSVEAGDINNDGIPDYMIGDPNYDGGKGIVYVIYGKKGTLRQFNSMSDFQVTDGFILKGSADKQKFGFSLGAAGDVDGDGIDDIIIGSFQWSGPGFGTETGRTYVIFGRNGSDFPAVMDVNKLPSHIIGFSIYGAVSYDNSGYSVSGAGDVNGDGINDVIVGAFAAGSNYGKAYVIFGTKWAANVQLPPAQGKGFTIESTEREHFGASVNKIGDFNGDGIDDIIIGAHIADNWRGRAYIVFGKRSGFQAVVKAQYLKNDGIMLMGDNNGDNFGCTVSGAGDFNGDGLKDVIVGAFAANGGRGSAYVIFGTRSTPGSIQMNWMTGRNGFSVVASNNMQLGLFVSGGRDLNGDGLSDVVVTGPELSRNTGAVYVIYGQRLSSFPKVNFDNRIDPAQAFAMYGLKEGDRFGSYATLLKDVNGDGVDDLIVGGHGVASGKGAAYLFYLPWTCPANCAECSNASSCNVCSNGFGLLEDNCVICPSTHNLTNGVCTEKPETKIDKVIDWFKDLFN